MSKKPIITAILTPPSIHRLFDALLRAMGRRTVREVEPTEDGKFLRVSFRGLPRALYWPTSLGLNPLYLVAQEQAYSWNWHYYEIPETKVLEDDVVLDCGAAEGLFSLRAADRCRSIIPIEPLSLFVECLRRTFDGSPSVRVVQAALSDHEGTASLVENGIASTVVEGGTGASVELVTVDALCARMDILPTYIKADLEGSEPAMIRGARKLISRYKPRLAITTYDDPTIAEEVKSLLRLYNPDYVLRTKGTMPNTGAPFMLHAW